MDLARERPPLPPRALTKRTFLQALGWHVGAFVVIWLGAWIATPTPEVIVPIDMTVVVDENLDREPDDLKPAKIPEPPKEKAPEPKVQPKVEEPPPAVDDKVDALVKEKEKPKKKEFKKGKLVKVSDKKPEKKPEKKAFKKGTFVKGVPPPPQAGNGPRTEKKLSEAEIRKLLALGARPGTKNQIAPNEESRCVSLIAQAIQREWAREAFSWHAGLKELEVTLRLGPGGVVRGFAIRSGSGDADVDRTANAALRRVRQVFGLSPDFIAQFPELTVQMKPLAR